MISAERLSDVSKLSELNGTAHYLSKTEQRALCDELIAARSRIASLEASLNERSAQYVSALGELVVLRAQGLSQEERSAIDKAIRMFTNEALRNPLEWEDMNKRAAILRRLGGQTT